ncbi:uncharacterized protein J5F26_017143 isoform 1-T1 [Ciconia maguari]
MTGGDPGLWEPCGSQAVGWRGRRVGGSWRPHGGQVCPLPAGAGQGAAPVGPPSGAGRRGGGRDCCCLAAGGYPPCLGPPEPGPRDGQVRPLRAPQLPPNHLYPQSHRCPHAPSLVGALAGRPPLPALAEVSEQLFRDGINWGRIVVFFYFTYRVVRQALWGDHPLRTILDWAISFLQQRLSAWIQHQGGWGSILSYSPRQLSQDPHAIGSPKK